MEAGLQARARDAVAGLDRVLDRDPEVGHADVQAAARAVVAFRDLAILRHREGTADRGCLGQANAIVSLVFGAEFPLSGLHFDRIRQARGAMVALLDAADEAVR